MNILNIVTQCRRKDKSDKNTRMYIVEVHNMFIIYIPCGIMGTKAGLNPGSEISPNGTETLSLSEKLYCKVN